MHALAARHEHGAVLVMVGAVPDAAHTSVPMLDPFFFSVTVVLPVAATVLLLRWLLPDSAGSVHASTATLRYRISALLIVPPK